MQAEYEGKLLAAYGDYFEAFFRTLETAEQAVSLQGANSRINYLREGVSKFGGNAMVLSKMKALLGGQVVERAELELKNIQEQVERDRGWKPEHKEKAIRLIVVVWFFDGPRGTKLLKALKDQGAPITPDNFTASMKYLP